MDLPYNKIELEKIVEQTKITKRHIVDNETTASDLCKKAASEIFNHLDMHKSDIGVLVFVTQYPDYILPSSAHILKHELGLEQSAVALQINEGCAGYLYGISVMQSLLKSSNKKYGLLLVGDTTSKISSFEQSVHPLFGDAGSATLVENRENDIEISLGSDGSGSKDIMVKDGFKNGFSPFPKLVMNGLNIFMFSISKVPAYIFDFCTQQNININSFDFIVLHQANKMMNERIVKKLGVDKDKVLYSIHEFGNTSAASIPLTITYNLKNKLTASHSILASGFGVGLSWGVMAFSINKDVYLDTVFLNKSRNNE